MGGTQERYGDDIREIDMTLRGQCLDKKVGDNGEDRDREGRALIRLRGGGMVVNKWVAVMLGLFGLQPCFY